LMGPSRVEPYITNRASVAQNLSHLVFGDGPFSTLCNDALYASLAFTVYRRVDYPLALYRRTG
ncbi:MAG: hypothetical protein IJY24_04440, partial [Clostridia bacterium]|nr:hypothetical protein [Clostridia bacterium]